MEKAICVTYDDDDDDEEIDFLTKTYVSKAIVILEKK